MARKPKKEEHVNHERWLVSYADFMTLLFAFFTSLYAISTVDAKKAGKMVFSTRAAFNLNFFPSDKAVLGGTPQPDKIDLPSLRVPITSHKGKHGKGITLSAGETQAMIKNVQKVFENLKNTLKTMPVKNNVELRRNRNNLIVSLKDQAFFAVGEATLLSESLPVLDEVAQSLAASHLEIRVEGHTDDVPIKSEKYATNWDLSAARATSVVRYLADEYDYPPELMSVAGYASGHPVQSNDTAEGRSANRRIDVVLLEPSDEATHAASPETKPGPPLPSPPKP